MKKHRMKCLINPTTDEIYNREPLLLFSYYLSDKNNLLLDTLDEIEEYLDNGFSNDLMRGDLIGEASSLMWFWTLGAYEIVRTISQAKDCFSKTFICKISSLKRELSKARMPSAKMEKQGKKIAVNSNRSPDGWDMDNKDLLIGDPDASISARNLFKLYDDTMSSLTKEDVYKNHADSKYYKSE